MAISYKRSKSWWVSALVVVVVALLILVLRLVEEIGPEGRPGDRFTVTRVIDGDTMELRGGDRLRLLAIDTPEESEPFYTDATRLAAKLALGQVGRIEYAAIRTVIRCDLCWRPSARRLAVRWVSGHCRINRRSGISTKSVRSVSTGRTVAHWANW